MKGRPTDFPPADEAGTRSFAIERDPLGNQSGPPRDRFHAHATLPPTDDSERFAVDGYDSTYFLASRAAWCRTSTGPLSCSTWALST